MRTALTVAGSDSIGGAGVQADVKAMSVIGVHATSVITAVTAQNTQGVDSIFPIPAEFVQEQLESVLRDCDIKAVKTGMLYSADIVETVADILEDHEAPLIVDPIMVSGTGDALSDDSLVRAMRKKLLPICELVTPNKMEAEILADMKIKSNDDLLLACELIGKQGSSVLMTGGHFNTPNVVDYLYLSSEFTRLEYPRLKRAGHGSGCVLSSYITANMAKGLDIVNAVMKSRETMQEAVASQYTIGRGDQVINPMVQMKGETDKFKVLEELDAASKRILNLVPNEFVPRTGMNIALALKDASGPEEIAAIDKRMVVHNGMLKKNGPAKFGAAEHLSYVLMSAMKHDPETRCAMSIAYSDDVMDIMEEVGFNTVSVNMTRDKILEATEEAISKAKGIPDAIADKNSKKNRIIRILAKDTGDMFKKLDEIL